MIDWPSRDATPASARIRRSAQLAQSAAFVLPWLNPFAAGPSTWIGPWLFSGGCAALAFALGAPRAPRAGVGLVLGGLAAWTLARSGVTPETLALAASCLLLWLMAATAAAQASDDGFERTVALAWLAAAVVSTAAALLQYFGVAGHFEPWVNVSATGEAFANLRQRNQFASLTAIGLAALLWLGPRSGFRWPVFAAAAWLAVGNAATTSRTGLLELLLLGVVTWHWAGLHSRPMRIWLISLGSYAAGALILPLLAHAAGVPASSLWERVAGSDSCGSRSVLWSNVLHLIAQRPWAGWGWGELDYAHYMTLYDGPRFCDILDNAHDLPLHLAVELGLPAAAAACGAIAWAVWRARPWREADPARQLAWVVLLVVGVHSLFEYPLWYGPFQIAVGLCLGLLWPALERRPWRAPLPALAGVLVLAGTAYAAWDYHRASQIYLPEEQRDPGWRQDPLARLDGAWLFRSQVRFAELTLTPLTRANVAWTYERASALLHYSPEPRVIEKLVESAALLHRDDEVLRQLARYRAAFPDAYAEWSRANRASLRR